MTAGGSERRLLDEVAHRIDTVVARGIELVHVVARATFDGQTRVAFAAWFAIDRPLAIEDLGEDASRRRLAGATGPRRYRLPFAL